MNESDITKKIAEIFKKCIPSDCSPVDSINVQKANEIFLKEQKKAFETSRELFLGESINSSAINDYYHISEIKNNNSLINLLKFLLILGVFLMIVPVILPMFNIIIENGFILAIVGIFNELISGTLIVIITKRIRYYHKNLRINELHYQINHIFLLLLNEELSEKEKDKLYEVLYKMIDILSINDT